ncbi:hypothetical protein [Actinoplanes sp. NPDC049802]|uniref:hypothetical protein n=1 Tax=Actinoplanes sp. NPDC049802 TaxID=3154742 RepID=UPI00340450E9
MDAQSLLHNSGEYARAFMAFSWCLSTFDRHPEVTRPGDEHALLWAYKWIVWELSQFHGMTLDQVAGLLDDMERRYRAGGHSLHAVHQHRVKMAIHLGDFEEAARRYDDMLTAPRDGLSDCQACVPTTQVQYLAAVGRHEEAVEVGAPFVRGGCIEQPHQILSHLLLSYLHTGRHAEAVEAHRTAYARVRSQRDDLELIALHVEFCALTGNATHGLRIVEQHLPWLDRPASPAAAMEFATASALLLRRLVEAGRGGETLGRRSDNGDRRWDSTVAETRAELAALARAEAARFDARNRNTYQSERIEARLVAEPIVAELPLTLLAGRRIVDDPVAGEVATLVGRVAESTVAGDAAGAACARLELAYLLRNAGRMADATETAEEARRSLDLAGLTMEAARCRYLLAELYRRDGRHRETTHLLLTELLALPELPKGLPNRAALLREAADASHGDTAAAYLLEAAALLRTSRGTAKEAKALVDAMLKCETPPADWVEVLARIDELPPPYKGRRATDIQLSLCEIAWNAGRPDLALERAQRHPELRWPEAVLLLSLHRPAEAEEVVRAMFGSGRRPPSAVLLLGRSLVAQGRRDEAEALLKESGMDSGDLEAFQPRLR